MDAIPTTALSRWRRAGEFLLWIPFIVLSTAVVLGTLLVGLSYWVDSTNRRTSAKMSTMVMAAYREAASRGLVPAPADEPRAILAGGFRCSAPPIVARVMTTSGERFVFVAEGHPSTSLKAETWTFRSPASEGPPSIANPK